jgi:hypothetical protein
MQFIKVSFLSGVHRIDTELSNPAPTPQSSAVGFPWKAREHSENICYFLVSINPKE